MFRAAPESFGPYSIHEAIGVGGMATVHRAQKHGASTAVALKRMLPQFAEHDEAVAAFLRESKLAKMMDHVNVARTFEAGRIGETYFIAMELISGRSVSELVQLASRTTVMPLDVVLAIVLQTCEALHYAHTLTDETGTPLGIIHRDVSPSNIIITDEGIAKLIDFGVAKGTAGGMQTQGITMKGKFGYMAPEYLFGKIDPRADIFAVGVICHELLANVPLFTGHDDLETMTKLRDMEVVPPSQWNGMVPPEIDDVVMMALEKDPDRRWQTIGEMRDAFETAATKLGVFPSPDTIVAWMGDSFGETLTFGDLDPMASPVPRPPTMTQFAADLPSPQQHEEELSLEPAPPIVSFAPKPLEPDDWARDTNINALIYGGDGITDPGAKPLEMDEPARPTPAIVEPERKPLPPPSVIVIAPQRGSRMIYIAALAIVAIGAAIFFIAR